MSKKNKIATKDVAESTAASAEETVRTEESVTVTETKTAKAGAAKEETFPVSELVAASMTVFKVQSEITAAALRKETEELSISKAKTLIDKFMRKEIK